MYVRVHVRLHICTISSTAFISLYTMFWSLTLYTYHIIILGLVCSLKGREHPKLCFTLYTPCMSRAAFNSLYTMVTNYPEWRHDIVRIFVYFLLRDVPDSCPLVLESTLKLLIQFISHWKQILVSTPSPTSEKPASSVTSVSCEFTSASVHCTLYCVNFTLNFTFFGVHSTMWNSPFSVYTVLCEIHLFQCHWLSFCSHMYVRTYVHVYTTLH